MQAHAMEYEMIGTRADRHGMKRGAASESSNIPLSAEFAVWAASGVGCGAGRMREAARGSMR